MAFHLLHGPTERRTGQPDHRPHQRRPQHHDGAAFHLAYQIEGFRRYIHARHQCCGDRHSQGHHPGTDRERAQEDLQREDRARQRYLVNPGQSGCRTTGHQDPAHLVVQPETVGDPSGKQCTQLTGGHLTPDRRTGAHRHDLQHGVQHVLQKRWPPPCRCVGRDRPIDAHHRPALQLQAGPAQRHHQPARQQCPQPVLRRCSVGHDPHLRFAVPISQVLHHVDQP